MKQIIRRTIKPKLFVSFSSYKTYKNCPELYRQNYLIPRDEQDNEFVPYDSYEASVGSAVQSVFEHLINKSVNTDDIVSLLRRLDDDIIYLSDSLVPLSRYTFSNNKLYFDDNHIITKFQSFAVDTSKHTLKQIRRRFISETATMYRKPLFKMIELFDLKKMSSEVQMQVEYKDFILGGKVDFIHYFGKSYIEILDGKRQYNPLWIDKEQVFLYAIMAEKQLNRKAKKLGYWDWKSNKIHYISYTPADLDETMSNIVQFKNNLDTSISTGKFRKKAGFHCRWCPIKDICEKYNDIPTSKGSFEAL